MEEISSILFALIPFTLNAECLINGQMVPCDVFWKSLTPAHWGLISLAPLAILTVIYFLVLRPMRLRRAAKMESEKSQGLEIPVCSIERTLPYGLFYYSKNNLSPLLIAYSDHLDYVSIARGQIYLDKIREVRVTRRFPVVMDTVIVAIKTHGSKFITSFIQAPSDASTLLRHLRGAGISLPPADEMRHLGICI